VPYNKNCSPFLTFNLKYADGLDNKKHFNLTQDCVYCTTGDPDVAPDGNLASGANVDDGSTTPRDRIWPRNHLTENKNDWINLAAIWGS